MKRCPACKFRFPDVHRVCDFDGTRLVGDPTSRAISYRSRFVSGLTSPVLWASLLGVFVLFTIFATAYLDAARQSAALTQVETPPVEAANPTTASNETPDQIKTAEPVRRSRIGDLPARRQVRRVMSARRPLHSRQPEFASLPVPELQRPVVATNKIHTPERLLRAYDGHSFARTETAPSTQSRRESADKDPKVVAVLKTTWRVLKWPFRF